jgi:hypothetical protein
VELLYTLTPPFSREKATFIQSIKDPGLDASRERRKESKKLPQFPVVSPFHSFADRVIIYTRLYFIIDEASQPARAGSKPTLETLKRAACVLHFPGKSSKS